MALFYAAIRRDSVSLVKFLFYPRPSFLAWNFTFLSLEISMHLFFFTFLFSSYCCSVDPCIACVVSSWYNQSFFALFLCSLPVIVSIYRRYVQCWWIFFFLLFLTHIVCLYHHWNVRSYASLLVFLFSDPFVDVLLPPLQEWSRVSYKGYNLDVYPFDEISAISFIFE